jgi:hypothetical protein
MTPHRGIWIIAFLELLALMAFFYFGHVSDSFLPERGGHGDGSAIAYWGSLGTVAFFALVVLWVIALFVVVRSRFRGGASVWTAINVSPSGATAVAIALPVFGLIIGYAVLLF